jgi:hypothetical protein
MFFEGPGLLAVIVGICTAGWVLNNWIRAKHGYPLEDEWGGKTPKEVPDQNRKIALLTNENEQLVGKIGHLEERIAVLERIATDNSVHLADEIERLR